MWGWKRDIISVATHGIQLGETNLGTKYQLSDTHKASNKPCCETNYS
jgi:hypothetical protein